jgi:hypothetical protein
MQRPFLSFAVALAGAVALSAPPAMACSDLPNICQMNAQHHQNMVDIAATPPWSSGQQDDDSSYDGGSSTYRSPPMTAEDWARLALLTEERIAREEAEHQRKLAEDPAYARFYNGFWINSPAEDITPARSCFVHFTRKGQGVVLAGPGGDYRGGTLSFYGFQVPRSKQLKTITMTLGQDSDLPQQVRVFSGHTPWLEQMGMVHFAVPDIDAALAGMTDEMIFDLGQNGERALLIKWHSGHKQRDEMRACLDRQKTLAAK